MNYKQKYEKALKVASQWHKDGIGDVKTIVECIFPELRESEDERIRKTFLRYVKNWQQGYCSWNSDKDFCNDAIAWLEKQGEQNPADKVESKFNIGDWITNGEYTWKVTDIKPLDYILQSPNGDVVDDAISYVNEHFHLWTIQDAKDGDVLAAYECYAIFKEIDDLNIKCYCTYHCMNNPMFFVNTLQNKTAFQPATKEQRELLFSKMKEAGYEWDAEKKELTKIEQASAWSEEDELILNDFISSLKYNHENAYNQ